nr:hypothetical protein [Tanacetum cinerariifolium]
MLFVDSRSPASPTCSLNQRQRQSGDHDKYLPVSFMNRQWIRRISLHGYGVLVFISSSLLVKFMRRYTVSSLMDTAY